MCIRDASSFHGYQMPLLPEDHYVRVFPYPDCGVVYRMFYRSLSEIQSEERMLHHKAALRSFSQAFHPMGPSKGHPKYSQSR